MTRTLVSLLAFAVWTSVAVAQPAKPKAANSGEERFKPFRKEVNPTGEQRSRLSQMKNGNWAEPISAADRKVLDDMARAFVYPVTHHEYYFPPDTGDLVPRAPETVRSVNRMIEELRAQLILTYPRNTLPAGQQLYVKEFGASLVQAVNEVLAASPTQAIRANTVRILEAVAESGAPAAWDKTIELIAKAKDDKNYPMEVLYYALRAAEKAIGAYDKDQFKWISKDKMLELVGLVEDVVLKVPACVIEKAYVPEKPATQTLTTDGKPAAPAPAGKLAPEQEEVIRMYRIQAVRALSRLRTDVVRNEAGDQERRPLHTLILIATSDPAVTPTPNFKEVGEAVIGLATMLPSDTANANVLGAAIAVGVANFAQTKVESSRELNKDAVQLTHWKVYGTRMKAAFTAWEKDLQSAKVKLPKADKDALVSLAQLCVTDVFEPLTKDAGGSGGSVSSAQVVTWRDNKLKALKFPVPVYSDSPKYTIPPTPAK